MDWQDRARTFWQDLANFPWRNTGTVLLERFREDRLGLTASSLTFTTTIALVPFFTVALAVFTAFPIFGKLQLALQRWLVDSLIPENIARQVIGYLTQFASQANRLGAVGLIVLLVTAIALILTIDRTLNSIWRVKKPRGLAQRVLIYWAAITLGPVMLGASLAFTSYALTSSRGLVGGIPGVVRFLFDALQFVVLAGGMAAMYRYVPNTQVKWGHAWAGGLFAAVGFEVAKKLLAIYIAKVPTYSMVYGAFATAPILLVWIYMAWVIVLLGAVIAAYLPSLLMGVARRGGQHGWQFQLGVEVLQQLCTARGTTAKGLSGTRLTQLIQVDALQLEPVLETLVQLDWVGILGEKEDEAEARYVLLVDPEKTELEPLMRRLLLAKSTQVMGVWETGGLSRLYLKDVL